MVSPALFVANRKKLTIRLARPDPHAFATVDHGQGFKLDYQRQNSNRNESPCQAAGIYPVAWESCLPHAVVSLRVHQLVFTANDRRNARKGIVDDSNSNHAFQDDVWITIRQVGHAKVAGRSPHISDEG